jgi:hypothetical protein
VKRQLPLADAQAIRAEIDAARGYPRVHAENEITRIGNGPHVEIIVTTTAVAIVGDGAEVAVMIDDADEKHIEPARAARLRAAKEPVEVREDEPTKGKGK